MRNWNLAQWFIAILTTILFVVLFSMLPGCSSIKKSQQTRSKVVDSSQVIKYDSVSHTEKDNSSVKKDDAISKRTLTVEFDSSDFSIDGNSIGNFSAGVGKVPSGVIIRFDSTGIETINLGNTKPKKLTVTDFNKSNKLDSSSLKLTTTTSVTKLDSAGKKSVSKEIHKQKERKGYQWWWLWFLVALAVLYLIYKYRGAIIDFLS